VTLTAEEYTETITRIRDYLARQVDG
jgi:hypothetical protein